MLHMSYTSFTSFLAPTANEILEHCTTSIHFMIIAFFYLGITFRGNVILPEHSPQQLLPNSCLTVSLQEMILCGGNISCHIPLIANETFRNLQLENHSLKYELNTARLKPGKYLLSAVINVGWCRVNSYKSKDLIHQGDYHSTTLHDVLLDIDTRVVEKDIEVDVMLPEETGIF